MGKNIISVKSQCVSSLRYEDLTLALPDLVALFPSTSDATNSGSIVLSFDFVIIHSDHNGTAIASGISHFNVILPAVFDLDIVLRIFGRSVYGLLLCIAVLPYPWLSISPISMFR